MPLPTDYDARKALPVYDFLTGYFPDAFIEVVKVAVAGNKQHGNVGDKIYWDRNKSMDQMNTALRHQIDHAVEPLDTDGCYHLAKAIWRLSAELQLTIEKRRETDKHVAQVVSEIEVEVAGPILRAYDLSTGKQMDVPPEYFYGRLVRVVVNSHERNGQVGEVCGMHSQREVGAGKNRVSYEVRFNDGGKNYFNKHEIVLSGED